MNDELNQALTQAAKAMTRYSDDMMRRSDAISTRTAAKLYGYLLEADPELANDTALLLRLSSVARATAGEVCEN